MVANVRHHPNAHPSHLRVVHPIYQPSNAGVINRPAYSLAETVQVAPKERIDEQRLHARIKELEILKQNIAQKQMEVDDKIATLDEQAMACHKQIDNFHATLSKLDELERHHSAEQIRLEQLIEQQRLADYQERIEQERLARQKQAVDEWNIAQKERQREDNSELATIEEPSSNRSNADSETTSSKPTTMEVGESDSEVQIQRPQTRIQRHPEHPTSLQVVPASKNPEITPGVSKTLGGVMKRGGVLELENHNVTSAA
ncbi:hypothetical protein GE061_011387 [Apolygus lucorum]|uniref:Uncharacterized protein n=1 Tax=Apolygus lucorum TaxID=248454 RepID=A0A6A4K8C4_APOLU|nr:hypothetical protein GE061_011387 [Apolygus lucorum]